MKESERHDRCLPPTRREADRDLVRWISRLTGIVAFISLLCTAAVVGALTLNMQAVVGVQTRQNEVESSQAALLQTMSVFGERLILLEKEFQEHRNKPMHLAAEVQFLNAQSRIKDVETRLRELEKQGR